MVETCVKNRIITEFLLLLRNMSLVATALIYNFR